MDEMPKKLTEISLYTTYYQEMFSKLQHILDLPTLKQ